MLTFGEGAKRIEYAALYNGGGSFYRDFVIDDEKAGKRILNLKPFLR